jgi:pimeloyl-ACP methyl ester carboxylesterase
MRNTQIAQLSLVGLVGIGAAVGRGVTPSFAARRDQPSIVLVHGAFADGSGWADVIRILQKKGYNVTAVQNPLSSYAEDIATTKRVIDAQPGAVVAVGHSYGGAVITGASAGDPKVKGLVYVAAFAPDAGEPIGAYIEKYPSALGAALRPDAAGFVYIDRAAFHDVFARDLPEVEANVMAATQKPVIGSGFASAPTAAAWRSIPSWYIVAQEDRAINPDLERFFARRMGANTREIRASHVVFISHPREVADVIEAAASAAARQ